MVSVKMVFAFSSIFICYKWYRITLIRNDTIPDCVDTGCVGCVS